MSKIFIRESMKSKSNKVKTDKNRKRKRIVNFRMSEEEKDLLDTKIKISGLNKQDYFIQIALNHTVNMYGSIKAFDELKREILDLKEYFLNLDTENNIDENKLLLVAYILEMLFNKNERRP